VTYWSIEPPTKWKLGEAGRPGTRNHTIVYAHCADCNTETELAGYIGSGPNICTDVGVTTVPLPGTTIKSGMARPAVFCPTCFGRRLAEAKRQEAIRQSMAVWQVAEQYLAKARGL
jgi:hypothetical protein